MSNGPATHSDVTRELLRPRIEGLIWRLDESEAAGLRALAERVGAGEASCVLAAWQIVLARTTGKERLVLGMFSNDAGRGCVDCDLLDTARFCDVARAAERSLSGSRPAAITTGPDVRFAFKVVDSSVPAGALAQRIEPMHALLSCVRGPRIIAVELAYGTGVICWEDAKRLLDHVRAAVRSAEVTPDATVGTLDILTAQERKRLLYDLNDTGAVNAGRRCIHEIIAERACAAPTEIAVVAGDREITFGELEVRSNRLAHHLVSLGARPGSFVAICLERSVEMAIGILGILKAGAAFVALDPEYPKDRTAYILKDTRAPILIADGRLAPELAAIGARIVRLEPHATFDEESADPLPPRAGLRDACYVVYTSGTTGNPKGVMVAHDNLAHYVHAMSAPLSITAADVYLHTASFAFSSSVRQLMLPLSRGARVVVATPRERREPLALFDLVKRRRVTVIDLVPSHWRGCLRALNGANREDRAALLRNDLRLCLSASEALGFDVPRGWLEELAHPSRFVNMFGHTETTGIVGLYPITNISATAGGNVPVGRPIANTRFYILDKYLQPVPFGSVGEVCIGGLGPALGYVGLPELTAQKFIEDPFSPEAGARMYRTGDLGRYLPSGDLEYLGRMDHQVKIRGHRVELGEVEARLSNHPRVRQSAVIAADDASGDKRLVAYVVPREGERPKIAELRAFMKEAVPEYMVPSALLFLEALPLSPNGKVDRRALPAPDDKRPELDAPYVAPRSEMEKQLVKVAEGVLGVRPIGIHDNVFDLGLTSLMAARLFAEIEQVTGTRLPVTALFEAPTIAEIAGVATKKSSGSKWRSMVAVKARGSKPPLFCIHGGAGTILIFHRLAHYLPDDQPVYAFQSRGLYNDDLPLTRIEAMAAEYIREMRSVQPKGPYYIAGFCFGGIVAFEMAQALAAQGERVELVMSINGPYPLYNRRIKAKLEAPAPFRTRLEANVRKFMKLTPRERVRFLAHKAERAVMGRIEDQVKHVRLKLAKVRRDARYWYHLLLKKPLADDLREIFFLEMHVRASVLYHPKPYGGRFVLVRARGLYPDDHLGWKGMARDGLELREVGGYHSHHRDIMDEPHTGALAAVVAEYLPKQAHERTS